MIIRTKLCKKRDCYRVAVSKGMCSMHYQRTIERKRIRRECAFAPCTVRRDYADGFCFRHHRQRVAGEALSMPRPKRVEITNPLRPALVEIPVVLDLPEPAPEPAPEPEPEPRQKPVEFLPPCPHDCGRDWHSKPAIPYQPFGFTDCPGSPTTAKDAA